MAALAIASNVLASAIFEFMKYLLTKAPKPKRNFYAKTIKESFRRIVYSVYPDITIRKSVRLQSRLTECLQSPDFDKDKMIAVLQEEGLSRKSAKRIVSKIGDEFKAIVDKEAVENPAVFRAVVLRACTNHDVTVKQITADLSDLREEFPALRLVLEASQAQLDRIEREVTKIAQGDRVIIPTIQSVLRKNDPNLSEGTFFRKEPAWIDFENGFIVERKEVDKIIKRLETCNIHLVLGDSSSGKSLVLKNVGFKLAKANKNVHIIELRKISERKAVSYFNEALKMKDEPVLFIVDDAHYQPAACEDFVREFRNPDEAKARLLVGSVKTKEILGRSPKLASDLEQTCSTELFAGDVAKEIIRTYLMKRFRFSRKKAVDYSNITFWKYQKDLWILSWALIAYDPKKSLSAHGLIEDGRIYEKIRDSIRNLGRGAEDALFPISVLYRFEVPMERNFLEEHIGIEGRVLEQLIDLSEIGQIEEAGIRRALILVHSSIAELYFEAYKTYPDLGNRAKKLIQNGDMEYNLFQWYLTKSDPTNSLHILIKLRLDYTNIKRGQTLLARLLEKEEVKISVGEGITKETDLDGISLFIRALFWGYPSIVRFHDVMRNFPSFKKRFLMQMYWRNGFNLDYTSHSTSERESAAFYGFAEDIARTKKSLELILTKYVDFDNLLTKIQREQDLTKVIACISNITRVNEKLGLDLARKVDFSKMKKDDFIELAVYCSNSGSFELFSEILRTIGPEKRKQLKNFLRYLGILNRPHFAQLRN